MKAAVSLAVVVSALVGCAGDVDEPWFLDHDRIVAVRATPPGGASGERLVLDALIGTKGAPTHVATPEVATVVSPPSLAGVLAPAAEGWVVTAPDEATLAAARTELGLAAGAPVPVQVGVAYSAGTLFALKTVWLGEHRDNPVLEGMRIDGTEPGSDRVSVAREVDVPLEVAADPLAMKVNWLTSCGTMHDFDLPAAYLVVEPDDPTDGELAVVVRDRATGGVAWRVWSLSAP